MADGKTVGETHYNANGTIQYFLRYTFDESGSVAGISYWGASGYWQDYYFVKNLQGDVLRVYQEGDDEVAAEYTYDAWGNVLTATGEMANINPFRYRSYYYDSETWFYYLQSRYYDPAIGRFINADGVIAGVGGSIQGNNMFAYCFNNPVNMSDSSGHWPQWMKDAANWVNNNIIQPGKQFIEDIKSDFENYDTQNTNLDKVYDANYFSSYKGALVIRHSSDVLTSWASNNTIVLNRNLDNMSLLTKENVLNHEYGHIVQEREMGSSKYTVAVFLPSVTFNVISRFAPVVDQNYYNLPWEHDADCRGGVKRANEHWLADSLSSMYFIWWGEKR